MKNLKVEFEENDVGVLTLMTKVKELNVIPARLSKKKNQDLYGLTVRTAGWGTSNDDETPLFKQTAFLSILTMEQCEKNYESLTGNKLRFARIYLCTIAKPYVLATCGNSGGPLFYKHNTILGINKGFCPKSADPTDMMNIHVGIDYYRGFILDVKNNIH
ncbi:hypothetical protein QAD02_023679 [Eretmocerus hayati]|uniref:Uncharacterized protein n=1 Tax=Eretmocerus hayati TaxID=131215 RepID=A0ACC2PX82_9HYME|nr:hypothetical protein QAD02_023679 [Eretmocerus hayati]